MARTARFVQWTCLGLAALAFFTLPVTSFPPLTRLSNSLVAPLAAIPLGLLAIIWLIPYLLKRGAWPVETGPLVIFILVCLLSSGAAFFLDTTFYKNRDLLDQGIRAYLTMAVGMLFYFTLSAWLQDEKHLRRSLQVIQAGMALAMVFAFVQGYFMILRDHHYPPLFREIRNAILYSLPHIQDGRRITGLTYEPSWYAHQMNMLFLPIWFSATYLRSSVFPVRIWKFSIENLLLIPGLVSLFLAGPRLGLIALMVVIVFLFFRVNQAVIQQINTRVTQHGEPTARVRLSPRITKALIGAGMLVLYVVFLTAAIALASRLDARVSDMLASQILPEHWAGLMKGDENTLIIVGARYQFGERFIYWLTGWHIFNTYPLLGVGLGNAGFHFISQMPASSWMSLEIRQLLYLQNTLPNIKNLWVRLLAETGMLGFSTFCAWLLVLWRSANASLRSTKPALRIAAMAGQLGLVAFLVEGFSIDSFAMPYLWVCTALIAGAGAIFRAQTAARVETPLETDPPAGQ